MGSTRSKSSINSASRPFGQEGDDFRLVELWGRASLWTGSGWPCCERRTLLPTAELCLRQAEGEVSHRRSSHTHLVSARQREDTHRQENKGGVWRTRGSRGLATSSLQPLSINAALFAWSPIRVIWWYWRIVLGVLRLETSRMILQSNSEACRSVAKDRWKRWTIFWRVVVIVSE